MKDAVVTVRLSSVLRRRIEGVARKEGRSLSAQIERLVEAGVEAGLEAGLEAGAHRAMAAPKPPALSGLFAGSRVPTLADFKDVRASLSGSLRVRTRR